MSKLKTGVSQRGKTLGEVLSNQRRLEDNIEHIEVAPYDSEINSVTRYRSTVLPGQAVLYPKVASYLYPNSWYSQRDEIDPRYDPTTK